MRENEDLHSVRVSAQQRTGSVAPLHLALHPCTLGPSPQEYTQLSVGCHHRCGSRGIYETLKAEPKAQGYSYCVRGFKLKELWPEHGLASNLGLYPTSHSLLLLAVYLYT